MLILELKHPLTFHNLEYLLIYTFVYILKKLYIENMFACHTQVYTYTFTA